MSGPATISIILVSPLFAPSGGPVLLHPHFGVRDAPDFTAFIKRHDPDQVGLKAIINDGEGIALTLDGVHWDWWFESGKHDTFSHDKNAGSRKNPARFQSCEVLISFSLEQKLTSAWCCAQAHFASLVL